MNYYGIEVESKFHIKFLMKHNFIPTPLYANSRFDEVYIFDSHRIQVVGYII